MIKNHLQDKTASLLKWNNKSIQFSQNQNNAQEKLEVHTKAD